MNKRGFTLIELIITIALLGTIGVIMSTNVINLIERQKDDKKVETKLLVEEAACAYAGLSTTPCERGCEINGYDLIDLGMLDEEINGYQTQGMIIKVKYIDGEKTCEIRDWGDN